MIFSHIWVHIDLFEKNYVLDTNFIRALLLFDQAPEKTKEVKPAKSKRILTWKYRKYQAKDVVVLYNRIRDIEVFGNVKD